MNPLQVALSVRSDFSLGESSFQIGKIIDKAKECGYTHVAVADLMTVSGIPAFTEKAKKAGITPIAGVTLHIVDKPTEKLKDKENNAFRVKVYPKSNKGMQAIFAALTKSLDADHFYYNARLGIEDVLEMDDVVVTSGDVRSLWHHPSAESISSKLMDRFGSDYMVEFAAIDTPLFDRINQRAFDWMLSVEEVSGSRPASIVSRPAFYATPGDADSTDVLRGITSNTPVDSPWLAKPYVRDLCLLPPSEMVTHFRAMPERIPGIPVMESIKNVNGMVGRCGYSFSKMAPSMPKMAENEFLALVEACKRGWATRFGRDVWGHRPDSAELATTYKERLAFELGVLKKMGFSGYFLLVQDIVQWSKENGILVGPGRGSCFLSGSQVVLDKSGLTKSIESLKPGDRVLAHDGTSQAVLQVLELDCDEEMLELEFDNGVVIKCTKDHKFFTKNRGWVAADEIEEWDEFDDVEELARAKGAEPTSLSPS